MTRVIAPAFFLLVLLVASPPVAAQVSSERLLRASDEPTNWLTYSGTYFSQRHSLLKQIDVTNATTLELKWVFQAQTLTSVSATPLVVDGIMYVTQPPNDIVALDAKSGRVFWTYRHTPSPVPTVCCRGLVNRGVAILGDTLFMATIDANLVAVDAINGRLLWKAKVAEAKDNYAMTLAPLVIKDKVIGIRYPGLHRCLQRADGEGSLAVLHDSWARRTWARNLGQRGRRMEARRRVGVADRFIRSGAQFDLLGHGEPGTRL